MEQNLITLINDPGALMDTLVRNIAAGGTLPDLCDVWEVRYHDLVSWLMAEKPRYEKFQDALNARAEWAREEIFSEVSRIAKSKAVDFFDDRGMIKSPKEWTPAMKSLVSKIKFDENGDVEEIQFWNKQKALDFLGKNLDMLSESVTVKGKFSLEDLIQVSREGEE